MFHGTSRLRRKALRWQVPASVESKLQEQAAYGRAVGRSVADNLVLGGVVIGMTVLPFNIWCAGRWK